MTPSPPSRRAVLGWASAFVAPLALAGCQDAATPALQAAKPDTGPIAPGQPAFVLIKAPITRATRDLFIADVNTLLGRGAQEVQLLLDSPGGEVQAALDMIDYVDRTRQQRGTVFVTHNVGTVASAACYLFLTGQRRLSNERGVFLFHEAGLTISTAGRLPASELQEQLTQLRAYEPRFLSMLKERTRLSDTDARTFLRRTVVLNSSEALRDGITTATANFVPPANAPGFVIVTRPVAPPGTPPPAPRPGPPPG